MSSTAPYADQPNRSPWTDQLVPDGPPRPLTQDTTADVAIVGAGIAGVATAFFTLRSTARRVLLIERDRVARGATGRNAGQLTTYFERPLHDIAREFGVERALEAQRLFDGSHDLLELMVAETGATVRVERFMGHMGMYSLNHLQVHLRNNLLRRQGGLHQETCVVSQDAEFLHDIAPDYAPLYSVMPQQRIRELLETTDDRYRAVLSERKGCANSAALVQQVLAHLERRYPDRFRYADHTPVQRVVVHEGRVELQTPRCVVAAEQVVMCTNAFLDHEIEDAAGRPIAVHPDQQVASRIAFMMAYVHERLRAPSAMSYILNPTVGGPTPYVYVTRRTYDRRDDVVMLTCLGGPDYRIDSASYAPHGPVPGDMVGVMDEQMRTFADPARPPGRPYDFHWHGVMAYSPGMIRLIGSHPRHPRLLYNLGCNGIGFLPALGAGERTARLLAGERFAPSIFDPR
jgi:glycine/D-amino acid oxidase-like deaminating enzyme